MDVLHCPHFTSSRWALASVPSRSINHTQSTTKLNRRGCGAISLPYLQVFFLYRLTPLSRFLGFFLLINLQLLAYSGSLFFVPSPFPSFLWLKSCPGANYINNCKVLKTPTVKLHQSSLVQSID